MSHDFDLFVIGGGSAGVRCARISAGHGARVAIAEERFWGGTCVNVGCVPKKIMVQAAEYGQWIEDANAFGWQVEKKGFDLAKLAAARNAEVARLNGIYDRLLGNAGVTRFNAHAKFVDAHTLDVGGKRVTADKIVIAVGGHAHRLAIPGAELGMISDDIFTLQELPKRLTVLGSGYIALEFACMFRTLGSDVDLVYRADLPLRGFDQDIRTSLKEAMDVLGIKQHIGQHPAKIEKIDSGLRLTLESGGTIDADKVLIATGRKPSTGGLGLEGLGVKLDQAGTEIALSLLLSLALCCLSISPSGRQLLMVP
jgi:glutathione reductase (NADPH)